jgi:CBS domain-containing protein
MRTVAELMSRVVIAVKPTDTLSIAKIEMDVARIRHLPVVDDERRVIGIVALTDVLEAIARHENKPVTVADIMSSEVRCVEPRAPAHQAARLMLDRKIGALPVVELGNKIVGMLTETDFLEVAEEALRRS